MYNLLGRMFRTNYCSERYELPFLLFSGLGLIIIFYGCCASYKDCWFGSGFNYSLFSVLAQISITLVAVALAVFTFLRSSDEDYGEAHFQKFRVSIRLILIFGLVATLLDCLALVLEVPSISLLACSADVSLVYLFSIPVFTILGRSWQDGISIGIEQRKEYIDRIVVLKHLLYSLCETLDQRKEYISFYDQIDNLQSLSKGEKKYLKRLYNRVANINTGEYIKNPENEVSRLKLLLQKVLPTQLDKRIDASVNPIQVPGFSETITDSYEKLMDNFSFFEGMKMRNELRGSSQGLAAPGYFNNGVADVTAKNIE